MKAGPVLLQKARARSASRFVQSFFKYNSATVTAPVGYPPQNPIIKAEARFPFTEKRNGIIFRNTLHRMSESRNDVKSFERTKKGNSEGITVPAQRSKEAFADSPAFSGNKRSPKSERKIKNEIVM